MILRVCEIVVGYAHLVEECGHGVAGSALSEVQPVAGRAEDAAGLTGRIG